MVALLPMKGNSERIPNKNIKMLNNKRLFYYVGDKLLKSSLFNSLIINTDSEKIADIANKRYGKWVKIIERPDNLLGDHISMNEIIKHDISVIGKNINFFQTHSTNPFLKISTIKKSVELFNVGFSQGKWDSVFSVNTLNARLYDSQLNAINHNPKILSRTQDLDVIYLENSNFYVFSGNSFMNNNHRIGLNPKPYPMNMGSLESLDIDTPDEWLFAERFLKQNTK